MVAAHLFVGSIPTLRFNKIQMKRVILVHGWEATSKSDFFPWLKKELDKKKVWNYFPDMPNTGEPEINEWVGFLKKNIKNIDEETILIGHSIGCQAVLRFMETLPAKVKIKKVILLAPWIKFDKKREQALREEGEEVWEIARQWIETPIDWEKVKSHCKNFLCIFSDNDPYVSLLNKEIFGKELNAKSIILHNKYHFNEGNGIRKLPEILEFLE